MATGATNYVIAAIGDRDTRLIMSSAGFKLSLGCSGDRGDVENPAMGPLFI